MKTGKNKNNETPEETKLWTAILKEVMRRNSPLQMFLLLDSYKVRWRRNEYRSVFCDQSAIEMRSHARLPRAEFTHLSRSGTASRTSDGEYLFWSDYFFHQNHCVLSFCDN